MNTCRKNDLMKKITFQETYFLHDNLMDLSSINQDLIRSAIEALGNAYAPYSKYKVGAGLLFHDQSIITGSNQENASFPLCICAESSVLSHAGSYYPHKRIEAIAITTLSSNKGREQIAAPCGACRQIILEFEIRQNHPIRIFLYQPNLDLIEIPSVKSILPLYFNNTHLPL